MKKGAIQITVPVPIDGCFVQDSKKEIQEIAETALKWISSIDMYKAMACYDKYKDTITRDERQQAKVNFIKRISQ